MAKRKTKRPRPVPPGEPKSWDDIQNNPTWLGVQQMNRRVIDVIEGRKRMGMFCSEPGLGKSYTVKTLCRRHGIRGLKTHAPGTPTAFAYGMWSCREEMIYFLDDADKLMRSDAMVGIAKTAWGEPKLVVPLLTNVIIQNERFLQMDNPRYNETIPPPEFPWDLGVLWCSNKNVSTKERRNALGVVDDFDALIDRGLDPLWINSEPVNVFYYTLWMIVRGNMLRNEGLSVEQQTDVVEFFNKHAPNLRMPNPRLAMALCAARKEPDWKTRFDEALKDDQKKPAPRKITREIADACKIDFRAELAKAKAERDEAAAKARMEKAEEARKAAERVLHLPPLLAGKPTLVDLPWLRPGGTGADTTAAAAMQGQVETIARKAMETLVPTVAGGSGQDTLAASVAAAPIVPPEPQTREEELFAEMAEDAVNVAASVAGGTAPPPPIPPEPVAAAPEPEPEPEPTPDPTPEPEPTHESPLQAALRLLDIQLDLTDLVGLKGAVAGYEKHMRDPSQDVLLALDQLHQHITERESLGAAKAEPLDPSQWRSAIPKRRPKSPPSDIPEVSPAGAPPPKRGRGRPPGAKNKPKS